MDWIFHAVATRMRFGSGPGSIVADVAWYPTTKPFIPFPTVYGSHQWVDRDDWEHADSGVPGEIWGARRRRIAPQFLPPEAQGDKPCGSREAWAGAYKPGDPLCNCPRRRGAFSRGFSYGFDRLT